MPAFHWLMKSVGRTSIRDLRNASNARRDGVRNYQAQPHPTANPVRPLFFTQFCPQSAHRQVASAASFTLDPHGPLILPSPHPASAEEP